MTPATRGAKDFVAGPQKAMQDAKRRTRGFAYLAGAHDHGRCPRRHPAGGGAEAARDL